jgi:hypothetical protein
MRWTATAFLSLFLQAAAPPPDLPPAYPRPGATKILTNERVQVWNIAWLKGQAYALHRHIYDLVGVYYEPGDRMIISPEGNRRPVSTKAGDIAFQLKGVTHIEEGASEPPLRAVFVEMKDDGPSGRVVTATEAAPTLAGTGATQRLDNARVTVWSYARPSGSVGPRHQHQRDAVVVWVDQRTPHAVWVPAGTVHSEEQTGATSAATIFELK